MEVKKMICINCPLGCSLEITIDGEEINVSGNKCKRGREYGISEIKDPRRIVTSTVRVLNGDKMLVSVKTSREIPKKLIFDVMKEINGVKLKAPVSIGDIVIKDILGTGVDVVATSNAKKI
ncbi:DUF1667 domain-containing protein [Fonticella tunisiensis]|uniref:CxxC motif-containing protein n=1 Tax=Fonticella tunisiensis TaxID=1096341 RepID=A0A4R7KRJ8_9CLOT|nr:DUF1667 domain-containing protein [Fonticella tunisiensis]TDT61366.1 CxxC motif-containing protein [Fonticella tunisiensis]